MKQYAVRWVCGCVLGTFIVAFTSPWFLRSYIPREFDSVRQVAVLSAGTDYRWRSEGYATTHIGEHGMPGFRPTRQDVPVNLRVALWGDSQAEGVCVSDSEKIHSKIQVLSHNAIQVFPLARSGDDCNAWISQVPKIDDAFDVDVHLFLVVEWEDWCQPIQSRDDSISPTNQLAAQWLPDFLVHAVRNVLTEGKSNRPRQLRFQPGPERNHPETSARLESESAKLDRFDSQLRRLRQATDARCLFLVAPKSPAIIDGRIVFEDDGISDPFLSRLRSHGFLAIDARQRLTESVQRHEWPRGFHNGNFGVGHFNAIGNSIIAEVATRSLTQAASGD